MGPWGATAPIHTHTGIQQGDPSSPLIWNLVINELLQYLNLGQCWYTHESGISTSALAFIYNCALLSDSAAGMRTLVARLNRFYAWAGLSINTAKCAVSAHHWGTNSPLDTSRVLLHGCTVPRLQAHQTYKYLGMEINLSCTWAAEKARVKAKL